jgi:ankyrin repeat protein
MRILPVLCLVFAAALCGLMAADQSESFYQAIRNDDVVALKGLLANGGDVSARDKRATTPLMLAAAFGSVRSMKVLLDAGADVNAKNAFDATPLMWAVYDLDKVRLLLAKGADVNARSKQGRTPLIIASTYDGNSAVVKLLLDKGAAVNARDEAHGTPLIRSADPAIAKLLIDHGADVNAKDAIGATALMNAVGGATTMGSAAWVNMLLKKGADVNAVSAASGGAVAEVKNGPINLGLFTPLLLAAAFGPPELVQTLLDAGANVNVKDVRGMTPLMLAIASDHNDPAIVKLLLDRGADPKIKSKAGEDAADWAKKFGSPTVLAALGLTPVPSKSERALEVDYKRPDLSAAVQKSLDLVQKSSSSFLVEGGCVSCHAQNITSLAVSMAAAKGIRIDDTAAAGRAKATAFGWAGFEQPMLQRQDPPGAADTIMYALLAMNADRRPADRITDAMVFNMAAQQHPSGQWDLGGIARPPVESGPFSRTALAIRGLQLYGIPGRKAEFDSRIARAKAWLIQAKPVTTEDSNMRLLGLTWTKAEAAVKGAMRDVMSLQRSDGGWAQTPHLGSDAYATGQALYALNIAGVPPSDTVYRRGVAWLLKTQLADGSWHVASRAPKFQPYFQSGFPHDHDQWISAMATGWAVMGLTPAMDAKQVVATAQ